MDIFDRIAAALVALKNGTAATDPAVLAHLDAIDTHLQEDDTHNEQIDARLDADETGLTEEKARVAVVEAGLQKIADALDGGAGASPEPALDPNGNPPSDEVPTAPVTDQPSATLEDGSGIVPTDTTSPQDTTPVVDERSNESDAAGQAGIPSV